MEQKTKMTTTCEWEEIVNPKAARRAYERFVADQSTRAQRLRKLWLTACGIATMGITFLILGATGAVAGWLTALIAIGSVTAASFVFGQYVEVKKR